MLQPKLTGINESVKIFNNLGKGVLMKKWIYLSLLILGTLMVLLQIFWLDELNGFIGQTFFLVAITAIVISLINLYHLSSRFNSFVKFLLNFLRFWEL